MPHLSNCFSMVCITFVVWRAYNTTWYSEHTYSRASATWLLKTSLRGSSVNTLHLTTSPNTPSNWTIINGNWDLSAYHLNHNLLVWLCLLSVTAHSRMFFALSFTGPIHWSICCCGDRPLLLGGLIGLLSLMDAMLEFLINLVWFGDHVCTVSACPNIGFFCLAAR